MQTFLNSFLIPLVSAAGGTTAVLLAIWKFFGKKIADYISNRAIEKYKSELSVKNHVSQYRFDKELESVSKILGALYELTLKAEYLRQNIHHNDEDEYKQIFDQCDEKIRGFADAYFKNNLYVNDELSKKFFKIVKLMDEYMDEARIVRYNINQLDDMGGEDLTPLGEKDRENCEKHYNDASSQMKSIVDEISTGEEFGYYSLVEQARKYFDGLSII